MHSAKGRKKEHAFIIEGEHFIKQMVSSAAFELQEIIVTSEDVSASWGENIPIRVLTTAQFSRVAPSKTPKGIAAIFTLPSDYRSNILPSNLGERLLILEDIQDPGNMGTLIRTAAAFNFDGILLSDGCADLFSPKVLQSTAGALGAVWIRKCNNIIEQVQKIKDTGISLIGTDLSGTKDMTILHQKKIALVLGNEGNGISNSMCDMSDYLLKIPFNANAVESLNVAVAGAVCMYTIDTMS